MEIQLSERFLALSHPARLAIVQLLLRRYPDLVPAGEIAGVLGVKPNTLSAYLADLMRAGLIRRIRRGTSLRYGADFAGLRAVTGGLLNECCLGRPDLCPPGVLSRPVRDPTVSGPDRTRRYRVLFVCTANSARSIFAEAILRDLAGDRFDVFSAGTHPQSVPNPLAVEMLRTRGFDIAPLRSKHLSEFDGAAVPPFDFVFTVCDAAANEACPPWPGQPMTAHWGTPDPVKATGTEAERMLAFQQAFGILRDRIAAFAALPVPALDRIALQHALDDISLEGAQP